MDHLRPRVSGCIRSLSFVATVLLLVSAAASGCGNGSSDDASPGAGGDVGSGGSGGGAGGDASSDVSSGGSAGTAGAGGSDGGGGKGGGDGSAGSAAGDSGADGGGCTTDSDCAALVPATTPSGCAEGYCDKASAACRFRAKDKDGDGHRAMACKALNATSIETGDDCDDTNKNVHPGAWDGPADGANAEACDGADEDCDGVVDDGVTASNKSCFCTPGDTVACSEDAGGHPISFPELGGNGKPLGACALGKKTCNANGQYGPCIGAIAPDSVDRCDGKDENCNGLTDMADTIPPINQITFTFDADGDNYADSTHPTDAKTTSCPSQTPTTCPSYLDTSVFTCTPATQWKTVALPLKDCNDNDPNVFPGASESCNGVDDDCNGTIDDSYATDAADWLFDYDGDNAGDLDVPAVHQCYAPATLPAGCATMQASLPSDYCTGLPQEGSPPACPPPDCTTSMWKKKIPQTDCKDRPDEYAAGGYKANLVHPGGKDLCNDHDYDCDGTPNTGCGCSPVGSSQPCGDAATCNAGTETCETGGVWGACSGGSPTARADYCPDADSDGYCNTDACQDDLCAQDAAKDKTLKLKSLCLPIKDCDDTNPQRHPAPAETCNGDGLDYNCNNIPNTPGAGDCQCVAGTQNIACAPTGFVYPPGATPGDPLSGVCVWGKQACNPDGTLTPCTGGTSGYATEQCNGDGKDYNCNGVANTVTSECGCTNGAVQSCENMALCNKGCTQTCANGQWGPNSVPTKAKLTDCYPDADHDGTCAGGSALAKCPPGTWGNDPNNECSTNCAANDSTRNFREGKNCVGAGVMADCNDGNASVRPYFSQADSTACGAGSGAWTQVEKAGPPTEKCGDGITSDCHGGDNDGYDVGAACNNGMKGSCLLTGTKVCNGAGSTSTVCNAPAGTPSSTYITSARNGSFDNNCNASLEYEDDVNHPGYAYVGYYGTLALSLCMAGAWNPCSSYVDGHTWWVLATCGPLVYPSPSDTVPSAFLGYGFKDKYGSIMAPPCGGAIFMSECQNGSQLTLLKEVQACR